MSAFKVLHIPLMTLALVTGFPAIGQSQDTPTTEAVLEDQAPFPDLKSIPETQISSEKKARRNLAVGISRQQLSNGYGHWQDTGARGTYEVGNHVLQGELSAQRHFDQSGTFFAVGDTITLDPDWFTALSIGAGDGAFYLPRYRVDGFINRKLLLDKRLIGTLGVGYFRAPDDHADTHVSLGATYYLSGPWIMQGEVRLNHSNPGSVNTHQQFLAVTWGHEKQTYITARHGWGAEGYQAFAAKQVLVNFQSRETTLVVRHWLNRQAGLELRAEKYSSPFYDRKGLTVSAFWELL